MVNANMAEVKKYMYTLSDDEYEQICMNAIVYAMSDGYLVEVPTNSIESVRHMMFLLDDDDSGQLVQYYYEYLTDGYGGFEEWYEENILEDSENV